jgi:WD40 repeat protein
MIEPDRPPFSPTGDHGQDGFKGTVVQTLADVENGLSQGVEQPPRPSLPGFEIHEEIGRGGMGVVYRARDLSIQRDVAVKILQERFAPDSGAAQRFLEESRITGQLQHPGIPAVYQIGQLSNGQPYLAMKLVKGETLDALLARPAIERPNFLAIFEAICHTVGYAHARGVIHRDLKPSNIMVGSFGETQVMDWGLAKLLTVHQRDADPQAGTNTEIRSLREDETRSGSVMGTPAYMSPEQACGETAVVDQRSDVFSLGGILCAVLTGQAPYTGADYESILRSAMRWKIAPAFERLDASGAEAALTSLAKRCLAEEPSSRPAHANEVARIAAEIRDQAEERVKQAEMERAKAEARAREQQRRRRAQVALIVVLVAGIAGSIYYSERALNNAAIAKRNEQTANAHAQRADQEAMQGQAEARESRRRLDLARLLIAQSYWKANQLEAARDTLDAIHPDHRCIAWTILKRQFQGAEFTFWNQRSLLEATLLANGVRPLASDVQIQRQGDWPGNPLWEWPSYLQENFALSRDCRLAIGSIGKNGVLRDLTENRNLAELEGHRGNVRSLALSRNAAVAVTGSEDLTARVWDLTRFHWPLGRLLESPDILIRPHYEWLSPSPVCRFRLDGHSKPINTVALSDDGTRIVTGSHDGSARIWDGETGICLKTLWFSERGLPAPGEPFANVRERPSEVQAVAITGDGSTVLVAVGNTVKRFEAASGNLVSQLDGHASPVADVAISVDGQRFATASWDHTVRLWEASTGGCLRIFRGHSSFVNSVRFSEDGRRLITSASDDTVRVWNILNPNNLLELESSTQQIQSVAIDQRNNQAVTLFSGGVAIWNLTTGEPIAEVEELRIDGIAVDPRTQRVFAASGKVWHLDAGKLRATDELSLERQITFRSAAFARDAPRVVCGFKKWVVVHDSATGEWVAGFESDRLFGECAVAISDNGARIAAIIGFLGNAVVWDVESENRLIEIDDASAIAFAVDGKSLLTGHLDGQICLWDVASRRCALVLAGHTATIRALALSRDGRRLVSAADDHTIRVWDLATGQCLLELADIEYLVESIELTDDGRRMATRSSNDVVRIWDAPAERDEIVLKGHAREIVDATFSPDGLLIATVSTDWSVRLWNSATGECVRELPIPKVELDPFYLIGFAADARWVLIAGQNERSIAWEVATGREVSWKFGQDEGFRSSVSSDGRVIVKEADRARVFSTLLPSWELQRFRRALLPNPDYHDRELRMCEKQSNVFATRTQQALKQRALARRATDSWKFDAAYAHAIAAATLWPATNPPK